MRGIPSAREAFERPARLHFAHYRKLIEGALLAQGRFVDAAQSLQFTVDRYGWRRELVEFGRKQIAPRLAADPSWLHSGRRAEAQLFLERLHAARAVDDGESTG
jgi:hypothetical protein